VFRRRRRPRRSLVSLLSDVTESCHSWLDQKVFRGMLGTRRRENLDLIEDQDLDWAQISKEGPSPSPLDESLWLGLNSTELDDSWSFTYDPTEAPPPPDKEAPPSPKLLIQEEICSEICQSKERFTQSLGGLSEVPPPPAFYSCCCQTSPEPTGELGHLQTLHIMTGNIRAAEPDKNLFPFPSQRSCDSQRHSALDPNVLVLSHWLTMKTLLIIIFTIFILSALCSGCLWWSAAVTSAMFLTISAVMFVTKSGPMGEWRRAKTEDITSRNE
ncbi:hypothetical protein CRENBAI_013477, partial [Crenichthys baileyi]